MLGSISINLALPPLGYFDQDGCARPSEQIAISYVASYGLTSVNLPEPPLQYIHCIMSYVCHGSLCHGMNICHDIKFKY